MKIQETPRALPVLPLKGSVLFPNLLMPVSVGRAGSEAAVEAAIATDAKEILLVAQRDAETDTPSRDDLYSVGTRAAIKKVGRAPEGHLQLLVQGVERVALIKIEQAEPYFSALYRPLPFDVQGGTEVEALEGEIRDLMGQIISLSQLNIPGGFEEVIAEAKDSPHSIYLVASLLGLKPEKEQALLEAPTQLDALRLLHSYVAHEVKVLRLRREIFSNVKTEMDRDQREYFLRQQLRAIQEELGETSEENEIDELRQRLEKASLPDEVRKEVERELNRLAKLPPASPEHGLIRTHVEFVLELPWEESTEDRLDLKEARRVLDEDHFGLKEIKERIVEHLGVLKLNPGAKAPILCFVGPPGVGKTSLGRSIARALNREFDRMSLGGLHDEAELRGHRRTYIGAMPGRILQALRRARVKNPLIMLDEVDKLGRDFRGDPAAALLEVLDPEQNHEFHDNYLDLPFDLSKVLFITTANSLETIPGPLRDRMEVIRLEGYSDEEKFQIARRYLIPRQLEEKALTPEQVTISDEALTKVASRYTREAGVRQLYRKIGKLVRKAALRIAEGSARTVAIEADDLLDLLGSEKFFLEQARKELPPGVATGLAWTVTGGEVLYVETLLLPESQGLTLTGQLGDVMRESAKAAQSYVWSHAADLNLDPKAFKKSGVHIHVPAGAIPKDGPSAGITMATALASLYTDRAVHSDTAMTGEITLTGLVLPVGGIKEKVLAARRAGLRRLILSKENRQDLRDLPEEIQAELEFIFAETIDDVLDAALEDRKPRGTLKKVG